MEGRTLLLNKVVQTDDKSPKHMQDLLASGITTAFNRIEGKKKALAKVRATVELHPVGLYVETVITLPVEAE
jgi:hypothetical protein